MLHSTFTHPDSEVRDRMWSKGRTGRTLQWTLMLPLSSYNRRKSGSNQTKKGLIFIIQYMIRNWSALSPRECCEFLFFFASLPCTSRSLPAGSAQELWSESSSLGIKKKTPQFIMQQMNASCTSSRAAFLKGCHLLVGMQQIRFDSRKKNTKLKQR